MSNSDWRQIDIRYLAVAASLITSTLMRIFPSSLNDDAYLYIRTAEIFLDQGFQAALDHYSWPVFSILIALVSQLGLSIIGSAFLVNTVFFALLVFAFLNIVKTIDSSRLSLTIAAICILVFPELNDYRSMVIRDMAFWSLSLLSVWQLLRYTKSKSLTNGLCFSLSLLIAAAFRVEALAYLFGLPLLLAITSTTNESKPVFFRLFLANSIGFLALTAALLAADLNLFSQVIEFLSVYRPFIDVMLGINSQGSAELSVAIFGDYASGFSEQYLWLFMATGLLSLLTVKLIIGIGPPVLLIVAALLKRMPLKVDRSTLMVLASYILINFLIALVFIFITRFLPSRYTMLLSLIVMVFVSLLAREFWDRARTTKSPYLNIALSLLLVYCSVGSYYSFGVKKTYIADAISWINEMDSQQKVLLTNNHAIAFGSGKIENYDQVPQHLTKEQIVQAGPNALLAVELNRPMTSLLRQLQGQEIVELEISFPINGEPRVGIYSATRR